MSVAFLQSFIGSNISQTLKTLYLKLYDNITPVDDVQVATALASCVNLEKVTVSAGEEEACVYGSRDSLAGLQAMAVGCPLLEDFCLALTVPALHFLGTHLTNLKKCVMHSRGTYEVLETVPTPEGFPSIEELQTLYPAVTWEY